MFIMLKNHFLYIGENGNASDQVEETNMSAIYAVAGVGTILLLAGMSALFFWWYKKRYVFKY